MSKNVIIGAGLSGRGYINRLFHLSQERVTFLDKDEELICKLQNTPQYQITFGEGRDTIIVDNYDAFLIDSEEGLRKLSEADVIFISIGANHVHEVLEPLQQSLRLRDDRSVTIITAENGIQPSAPLESLRQDPLVQLSEAVIFCTTLGADDTLDIFSEDLDHLPYDAAKIKESLPYIGMVQEFNFPVLLERKIYTYNCISACYAYLGYDKGYVNYADAANDPEIATKVEKIAEAINESISKEYVISLEEQRDFSRMAIRKFQNRNITDTVERNVRDVERKLGVQERILAPLAIIEKHGGSCEELLEVAAAAIRYGQKTQTLTKEPDTYFESLPKDWQRKIMEYIQS